MATFDASQATYNQPIEGRLGEHGVSYPVGNVVYIDTNDNVYEAGAIMGTFDQHISPAGYGIATGSGDNGYAIFRRGKSYTITAGEQTLLDAAGYTIT